MAWFVELQSEHCDEKRRQRFQAWLAEHEAHQWAYQEAENLWSNMDNLKFGDVPGLESARQARPHSGLHPALSALLLGAAMAGGWQEYTAETLHYETAIGQRRGIELADGSHIELNAASRLSVRISPLRRRIELLEGEAQFSVAHGSLRPFTVDAGELHIRDIGTVFTVQKHRQNVSVSVVEGVVAVNDSHRWFGDDLKAGYRRQLDRDGRLQAPEQADVGQATAWIRGILAFDHTTLAEAAAELERHHAVRFVFADPDLPGQTLSGSFDSNDLDAFLKALEKMLPVRVRRDENTIVLSRR